MLDGKKKNMNKLKIKGIYKHFKGDYYIVEDIATHSETNEKYVIYRALYGNNELYIRPLSIFIPDPISYGAANRVSVERIEKIMDEVNWNTPSWINSTRFVMDTTIGKVRRENIIKREEKCLTFMRDGKTVKYYDLDDGIDVSTDINILLWKDNNMVKLEKN